MIVRRLILSYLSDNETECLPTNTDNAKIFNAFSTTELSNQMNVIMEACLFLDIFEKLGYKPDLIMAMIILIQRTLDLFNN